MKRYGVLSAYRTPFSIVLLSVAAVALAGHAAADITPAQERPVTEVVDRTDCERLDYHCNIYTDRHFPIPNEFYCDSFNMRFTPPSQCTLKTVSISFYDNYPEFSDVSGSGVDVLIWNDNGSGFPQDVLYAINVPSSQMVYYPDSVVLDIESAGLVFEDDFHIGYTTVDQVNDSYALIGDDGSCGELRSSSYRLTRTYWSGMWETMLDPPGDGWAIDVNFIMAAEVCGSVQYECGDVSNSGGVEIDDVVYLVSFIFIGGPPPEPYESGDVSCNGGVDIDDVVWLIAYIFSGGNAPCDTDGDGAPDC